jgi:hypothetical protein
VRTARFGIPFIGYNIKKVITNLFSFMHYGGHL